MIEKSIEQRIDQLQAGGIIDLHFDLPMDLYEKRGRKKVLETEFLPELKAGNIGVVGVAIYIADRYLPDAGLRVALDQIARLYAEAQTSPQCAICKSYRDIENALKEDKIALGDLRYSAGLAVSWASPMGPMKFSIAKPLNARPDDREERFQFVLGSTF